jgi:type I restriction enzyme S subunit
MMEEYKETPLGDIPNSWKVNALNEITKVYDGTHQTPKYVEKGIPFYSVEHVTANDFSKTKFVSKEVFIKENQRVKLEKGDILMTRIGDVGTVKYIDWDVNASFYVSLALIKQQETFNGKYIAHFIESRAFKKELWKRIIHTAFPRKINLGEIGKCLVVLPPLPEQQKIAEILGTVDAKIEVIDQQITETQELKKGLMQRLLTKGIGHTEFKDSPLGEIPKSWEISKLRDVAEFSNGKGHEKSIDENGRYIVVNSKFISTEGEVKKFSNQNLSPLRENDITMVMSDIPNGKAIAKCFIIDENERYTLNQRICSIQVNDKCHYKYLYYVMNRNRYYLAFDNGVSQTNLRKDEVLDCPIQLPPLQEQQKIAKMLSTVDDKIEVLTEGKINYQELKKGLMQQLLTGKVRVKLNSTVTA